MPSNAEIKKRFDERKKIIDEWQEQQLKNLPTQNYSSRGLIMAIQEQLLVQERFYVDMNKMKNMLTVIKEESKLSQAQIQTINAYTKKLDTLINTHEQFITKKNDIVTLLENPNTSPEKVLKSIQKMYHSDKLQAVLNAMVDIALDQADIDTLYSKVSKKLETKKKFTDLLELDTKKIRDFSVMPAQTIPRTNMVLKVIENQLNEIHRKNKATPNFNKSTRAKILPAIKAAVNISEIKIKAADGMLGSRGAEKAAEKLVNDMPPQTVLKEKQTLTLRNILSFNINTPLANKGNKEVTDFPAYLKTLLIKVYPDMFRLNPKGEFSVTIENNKEIKAATTKHINIMEALGISFINLPTGKVETTLNPTDFNAIKLDELYAQDKNPLWRVLKSTKPVDEHFTITQKIQAYIDIAKELKKESLGKMGKYKEAYNVAQAAIALAKNHPGSSAEVTAAFGPESDLGKWIIKKTKSSKDRERVIDKLTVPYPALNKAAPAIPKAPDEAHSEVHNTANFRSSQSSEVHSTVSEDNAKDQTQELENSLPRSAESRKHATVNAETENQSDAANKLYNKKSLMINIALPTLNKILTHTEREAITKEISGAKNLGDLLPIERQIQSINAINATIVNLTKNLGKRDELFSSSRDKKIRTINTAFQALSLEDKVSLAKFTPAELDSEIKKDNKIGNFLKIVNYNRGLIPINNETTSFKEFKNQMHLLKDPAPEARKSEDNSNSPTSSTPH